MRPNLFAGTVQNNYAHGESTQSELTLCVCTHQNYYLGFNVCELTYEHECNKYNTSLAMHQ